MSAGTLAMRHRPTPLPIASEPVVSNTRLAVVSVIVSESMLFAGLIGMYLVFRLSAPAWPPPDLPRLPVGITALNSLVLLSSLVPLTRALHGARRHAPSGHGGVQRAALLGAIFLAIQGMEWLRLVRRGLTLSSGAYGGSFYLLIGCHAVHVLVAVVWLAALAVRERRARLGWTSWAGLEMCTIYWYFVCGLWLVLFPLVYLY
jgi:heme/copper-type cytochrome/quinol oxidase subunit 3